MIRKHLVLVPCLTIYHFLSHLVPDPATPFASTILAEGWAKPFSTLHESFQKQEILMKLIMLDQTRKIGMEKHPKDFLATLEKVCQMLETAIR